MLVWCVKTIQYEKIDVSEGTDIDKTTASKECILCHYWYFKDVGYKFEPHFWNKCHDVLMTAYELKSIAILNVKRVDYRCILCGISKNEAVKNDVTESHGKNLMSWKILIKNIIVQVIMMLVLINMVLSVEHH